MLATFSFSSLLAFETGVAGTARVRGAWASFETLDAEVQPTSQRLRHPRWANPIIEFLISYSLLRRVRICLNTCAGLKFCCGSWPTHGISAKTRPLPTQEEIFSSITRANAIEYRADSCRVRVSEARRTFLADDVGGEWSE